MATSWNHSMRLFPKGQPLSAPPSSSHRSYKLAAARLAHDLAVLHHHLTPDDGINRRAFDLAPMIGGPADSRVGGLVGDGLFPFHVHDREIGVRSDLNRSLPGIDAEDPGR